MNYFDRLKKDRERREKNERVIRDIVPPSGGADSAKPADVPKSAATDVPIKKKSVPEKSTAPVPQKETPDIRLPVDVPERRETPKAEVVVDEKLTHSSWEVPPKKAKRRRWKAFTAGVISALLLALILPTAVFPKISVAVYPKIQTIPVSRIELIADSKISTVDASGQRIPAILIAVDKTMEQEFEASGSSPNATKAHGRIQIYNAFSTESQTLVATTRFEDASGKIYRIPERVVVPGARQENGELVPSSISVDVTADQSGPEYNIEPTEFRIPGFRGTPRYDGFYARSVEAFTGGSTGNAKVVTAEDLTKASENITKTIVEELQKELQTKIPSGPDFFVPNGARTVTILEIQQPKAGEARERFPVTVKARGEITAVRRSQALDFIGALVLGEEDKTGVKFPVSQDSLVLSGIQVKSDSPEIQIVASGNLAYYREPDAARIADEIRGARLSQIEDIMRGHEEVGSFRTKRFPPWLWFIPKKAQGLVVEVEPPL